MLLFIFLYKLKFIKNGEKSILEKTISQKKKLKFMWINYTTKDKAILLNIDYEMKLTYDMFNLALKVSNHDLR